MKSDKHFVDISILITYQELDLIDHPPASVLHISTDELEKGEKEPEPQSQISMIEKNGTDHISTVKMFADVFDIDWIELLRMSEE